MRILDQDNDRALSNVSLLLTAEEAKELLDTLEQMLAQPKNNHGHVPSADFKKELTVALYEEGATTGFDKRAERLILSDE